MRIVISDDIPDGIIAVKSYSLGELVACHAALDALDQMRELQSDRDRRARDHKKMGGR